jgi:hypothetical protein
LSIAKGGAQRQQPVLTGIVVNNFNFNVHAMGFVSVRGDIVEEGAGVAMGLD